MAGLQHSLLQYSGGSKLAATTATRCALLIQDHSALNITKANLYILEVLLTCTCMVRLCKYKHVKGISSMQQHN
jgi:hypothetical protein